MSDGVLCQLCGEPMPEGEEMFVYHGYSGPCPRPPLSERPNIERLKSQSAVERLRQERDLAIAAAVEEFRRQACAKLCEGCKQNLPIHGNSHILSESSKGLELVLCLALPLKAIPAISSTRSSE